MLLSILGVAAFAAVLMFNVNVGLRNYAEYDVAIANIEAIAKYEDGGGGVTLTCSKSSCHGKLCHEYTGNWVCPCDPTGKWQDQCPI